MRSTMRTRAADQSGFTLPEMLIALTITAVAAAVSFGSFAQYRESTTAQRAVRVINADVMLTRSFAIRGREPVSLVANETLRSYVVRDTAGNILHRRVFDLESETRLTGLDVRTAGDSLTFDSRGILLTGAGTRINATRNTKMRSVTFNALGRGVIN